MAQFDCATSEPDWIRTNDLLLRRQLLYPTELPVQYFSSMTFPTKPRKPFPRKRLLCVLVPSWQNFSHEGTKTQRLLRIRRALCGSLHLTAENAEKAQSFCQRTGVFVKSHFSKTIESVASSNILNSAAAKIIFFSLHPNAMIPGWM